MKTIDFNEIHAQQLDEVEAKDTNGGWWQFAAGALAGAFLCELIFEGIEQCWEDFMDGYNSTKN